MTEADYYAVVVRNLEAAPADTPPSAPTGAPVRSYVALGDSFTAGTGCPPGSGWADLLADWLRLRNPDLAYKNFAFDGATSSDVLAFVGDAIKRNPDLITVISGSNDVLGSVRPDPDLFAANMAASLDRLSEALPDATMLTATVPEQWQFVEVGPRTRKRIVDGMSEVNERIREISDARGIVCLDLGIHSALADRENFGADGLHPSPIGHERFAAAFEWPINALLERRLAGSSS